MRVSILTAVAATAFGTFAWADATSDNAKGFAAYQKGEFAKAGPLFSSAIKQNPKLAFAWLNQSRTIVALSGGKEPDEYCSFEQNWMYLALSSLSKAVELDSKGVLEKILTTTEAGFKKFMATPEYKKWAVAVGPLPKGQAEITKYLESKNNEWITEVGFNTNDYATFAPAGVLTIHQVTPVDKNTKLKWTVKGDVLELSNKRKFKLERKQFFFDDGKQFYYFLSLEEQGGKQSQWVMGPLTGDCG